MSFARRPLSPTGHLVLDAMIAILRGSDDPEVQTAVTRAVPCRWCAELHPVAFFWRGLARGWHEVAPQVRAGRYERTRKD